MSAPSAEQVTGMLLAWGQGDDAALEKMMPLVYGELKRLAHHYLKGERAGHVLQTTDLVNEAYLRLIDARRVQWQNRAHFFAMAASLMRRVLVDAARKRNFQKRGGGAMQVSLNEALPLGNQRGADLIALDDALEMLAEFDSRKCKVVELRFFGGLSVKETAEVLRVSQDTVMRDWSLARAWLLNQLGHDIK
jgi:RNA polymerase sigma-70 factor, ECF subfamily